MYRLAAAAALILASACGSPHDRKAPEEHRAMTDTSFFDTTGWTADGANHWRNARGGELQITTSPATDELSDVARFRERTRNAVLARSGGLVSADLSPKGVGVAIAKYPQQPSGMTYEGTVAVVKNGTEHRATVRFPEAGTTGMRDAVIFDVHMQNAAPNADLMEGWMADPYDHTRHDPLMRNGADDEQYDARFPDHPLSLVRAELRRLEGSL